MDESGIITEKGPWPVEETVRKLQVILAAKGVKLFALIDHSGEAEAAGLRMPPTKLLIFGAPKAGTPIMLASPTSAIDLPLKLLVWQHPDGSTRITYNSPAYLQERHNLPRELAGPLASVAELVRALISA